MKEFNCLDPETSLSGKIFLEASAGTGKTFAIEHVVARLILEKYPIDKILITTFTNAGVRDLKRRVYQNLKNLLLPDCPFPYLKTFPQIEAKLLLKNALRLIDEAQIFTIHSFCSRMLTEFSFEANIDPKILDPANTMQKESLEIATLDVLRCLVDSDEFSPAQLKKFTQPFKKETKNIVKKMISFLSSSPTLPEYKTFKEIKDIFESSYYDVKEALTKIAPSYAKTTNRSGELHQFVAEQIDALQNKDLEKLILSTPSIFDLFVEENLKKNKDEATHPLIEKLRPIIAEASDPFILFCRVAKKVQQKLDKNKQGPNILLETMFSAMSNELFRKKVTDKYLAVIIDEFQDTDPLQWKIFSSLSPKLLMVVGDPKQSIYAFRGADLQTFLNAKKEFSNIFKLSSNYRSDPLLIESVNKLFNIPNLFTLSHESVGFSYEPLQAKKNPSGKLNEEKVEFILSKSDDEFSSYSFIAKEIQRLDKNFSFAVLVKDRFEAFKLTEYLQNLGLSVSTTSTANITEGKSFSFLLLLSKILKSPKNQSLAKEFLYHPFIHWDLEKIKLGLEDADFRFALTKLIELSRVFKEDGYPALLTQVIEMIDIEKLEDYADFIQICGLVLENKPESLHSFLEKISILDPDDHSYLKRKPLFEKSKIVIMTSHMSKGLEFDVVFLLGTMHKSTPSVLNPILSQDLEKLRLFYVAATRAKEKMYIFVKLNKEKFSLLTRSPVELLLAKLCNPNHAYENLNEMDINEIKKGLEKNQFAYQEIEQIFEVDKVQEDQVEPQKKELINLNLNKPKQFTSFSSLANKKQHKAKSAETLLPRGPETGNLIHLILEKMIERGEYYDWNEEKIKLFIEREIYKTHLDGFIEEVYNVIHAAFHTELDDFCLKDIHPNQMLQEHQFTYKIADNSFMCGFIDLVFLFKNEYYILDWKMNVLDEYTIDSMEEEMENHSYFSQAEIYKEALSKTFKDYPLKKMFYFFLRGKTRGVYKI
jgi:exodeoxyribonuclease V beta subunit